MAEDRRFSFGTFAKNAHSDYIIDDINTYGYDLDIVVEAKAKELAVLGWRKKYRQKNKPELAQIS